MPDQLYDIYKYWNIAKLRMEVGEKPDQEIIFFLKIFPFQIIIQNQFIK